MNNARHLRRAAITASLIAGCTLVTLASIVTRAGEPYSFAWTQEQTLLPFATQSNARFGSAVSADGNIAAIGMPYADVSPLSNSGLVYTWRRTGGTWTFSSGITSTGAQNSAYFGSAVAIGTDRLYVGSPSWDPPVSGGLVEEFHDDAGNWTPYGGVGGAQVDRNGSALAEDGGLVAMGAPGPCTNCGMTQRAGRVFVTYYFEDGSTFATIAISGDGDHFGQSVAVYRSPDPAQPDLLVVGAPENAGSGIDAGAVYVFANATHTATGWNNVAILRPTTPAAGDLFGRSVAVGPKQIVVGAPDRDVDGVSDAGALFFFVPNGSGGWQQEAEINLADAAPGDLLGSAVAYDRLHHRAFGGAPQRMHTVFGGSGATGSVIVFHRITVVLGGLGWVPTAELYSFDGPSVGQQTGQAMAVSGDRLFVGAPGYDANGNNGVVDTGRVLVFVADEILQDGFDGGATID